MIRYCQNSNSYDCGAVAFVNTLKWSGQCISYKKTKHHFIEFFNLIETKGLHDAPFEKFLRMNKFPFKLKKVKRNIKIKELIEYIDDDHVVIIGVHYEDTAHIGLVIKMSKKYMHVVNWGGNKAVRKILINNFKRYMKEWNVCYFIKKDE